jgi:hypothetical protein
MEFPDKNFGQEAGLAPRKIIETVLKVTMTASSLVPRNSSFIFTQ